MSPYQLMPVPERESALRKYCTHAWYVGNLAVEQQSWWRPRHDNAPGYCAQVAQLTTADAEFGPLAVGSQVVQQQALRDFTQAMADFYGGTHGESTWREEGQNEGFRIVAVKSGHIRRLSRHTGEVLISKVGWYERPWREECAG